MLHNRYQFPGGEDASAEAEVALLRHAGHEVTLLERHNDEIQQMSIGDKVALFAHTIWNSDSDRRIRAHLRQIPADILHVQNFFPLWSPSVYAAARSVGIPTVQHLRNFRLACLNAYLLRNGQVCEACVGKNPWRGVVHRCYRRSLPASLAVWSLVTAHRWGKTWIQYVDAFIAPSRFAAEKLVQVGIPSDRLHVKPDFIDDPLTDGQILPLPDQPTFAFIGRLNDQKGVALLLEAWRRLNQTDWRLELVGTGDRAADLRQFVQDYGLTNVQFHGQLPPPDVLRVIQSATAVVVPSQSYETFGRVVIEAFACGRSALVANLGALPELVHDGATGFTIPHQDQGTWVDRLRWAGDHPQHLATMGRAARQLYLTGYTPAANYQQLSAIYDQI